MTAINGRVVLLLLLIIAVWAWHLTVAVNPRVQRDANPTAHDGEDRPVTCPDCHEHLCVVDNEHDERLELETHRLCAHGAKL